MRNRAGTGWEKRKNWDGSGTSKDNRRNWVGTGETELGRIERIGKLSLEGLIE